MRRALLRLGAAAWILLVPAGARAGPTGLTFIPTTELVPFHQVNGIIQNGNTAIDGSDAFFHDFQPDTQIEAGLPFNVEGGVDVQPANPPNDYRPNFNLKWRPLEESQWIPAGALGVASLGPGFRPTGFLVLDKTLNYDAIQYQKFRAHHRNIRLHGIQVHAGFAQVGQFSRAMLGIDVELSDHFLVWADWISGASNDLSLAGCVVFDAKNSLWVALLRQNDEDRLSGVAFNFTHTFDW
jgi:hypothetical protein